MQRRSFIKDTALCAVALSASGFIRFDGEKYVADCETTSDILGPYYRPDSPVRNNLVLPGDQGYAVHLRGVIKHQDCRIPYKNAKVELWHCSGKGEYDNTSSEYNYRGTTFTDDKGRYSFKTVLPVPYKVDQGNIRPAHFHLMITANGYMPLITQLYFTGDIYIPGDPFSANAKKRILNIEALPDGTKSVEYNVGMSSTLLAEPAVIDKLTGVYISEADTKKQAILFKNNNTLWMKNEVYGNNFDYAGNNTFKYPGVPTGMGWTLAFEIMNSAGIKLTETYLDEKGKKEVTTYLKKT